MVSLQTKSIVLIKEEIESDDDGVEVHSPEGDGGWTDFEDEMGMEQELDMEGMEESGNVDEKDPLSLDYEMAEANGNLPLQTIKVENHNEDDVVDIQSDEEEGATPVITSVASVNEEIRVGLSKHQCRTASFNNLDIYRCYLCRYDFSMFDDYLSHRTSSTSHASIPYDGDKEKAFSCGICQKPWNQPRKALSCALFGHDPAILIQAMFIHNCPICPDTAIGFHSLSAVGEHWSKQHPEKPIPKFLISMHIPLPTIKVTPAKAASITLSTAEKDPQLVLENFPDTLLPQPKTQPTRYRKLFPCKLCSRIFETRYEMESHVCEQKVFWDCDNCGRRFESEKNFRSHLSQGDKCHRAGQVLSKEDYPYKCFLCRENFPSFKAFACHRSKAHRNVPYNINSEKPFACKLCQKPAFFRKEAMICALFGHDPSSFKKLMFRYRCSYCTSFGFHSMFAIKKHLEKEHPNVTMPPILKSVEEESPLPSVTVSLEQLKSLPRLWSKGCNLVSERYPESIQSTPTPTTSRVLVVPSMIPDVIQSLSSEEVTKKAERREMLIQQSLVKGVCVVCTKYFKDMRRHMQVHDNSRFDGPPKHQCVCGRWYHIRNSLHSHWKTNKLCKERYLKEVENNPSSDLEMARKMKSKMETVIVVTSAQPTIQQPGNADVKKEVPSVDLVDSEDDQETYTLKIAVKEQSPSEKKIEPVSKNDDLYKQFAELDAETPEVDASSIYGVDLKNYLDLDIEEVPDDNCRRSVEVPFPGLPNVVVSTAPPALPEPPVKRMKVGEASNKPSGFIRFPRISTETPDQPKNSFKLNHDLKKLQHSQPIRAQTESVPKTINSDLKLQPQLVESAKPIRVQTESVQKKKLSNFEAQTQQVLSKYQKDLLRGGAGAQKRYLCSFPDCGKSFRVPSKLKDHASIHTGEKPFECEICGAKFRVRRSLVSHRRNHNPSNSKSLNCYKCLVCGKDNFTRYDTFLLHRKQVHKEIQYDKEKEKPFGCGVCQRPYDFRSQAMVCAVLGHDPKILLQTMFRHKCPACPPGNLGFHNFASIRTHWVNAHEAIPMPTMYLRNPMSSSISKLPVVTIDPEKAEEIRTAGPQGSYDFETLIEFELLGTPECDVEIGSESEPIIESGVVVEEDYIDEYVDVRQHPKPESDLLAATEISVEDAIFAVKALVISNSKNTHRGSKRKETKKIPVPQLSPREAEAADRALGSRRIAKLLQNIRTGRSRRAAILQNRPAS